MFVRNTKGYLVIGILQILIFGLETGFVVAPIFKNYSNTYNGLITLNMLLYVTNFSFLCYVVNRMYQWSNYLHTSNNRTCILGGSIGILLLAVILCICAFSVHRSHLLREVSGLNMMFTALFSILAGSVGPPKIDYSQFFDSYQYIG